MFRALFYAGIGYCSGSLLFARYFSMLFRKRDVTALSPDQNPGTFNAFRYGGVFCGICTLLCELLKGFLPVYLYRQGAPAGGMGLALVLAAPVCGHIFPAFHHWKGGKGIAVSFGCLLGLAPYWKPLLIFAASFLFFSLVIRITPHYHRTICTYLVSAAMMALFVPCPAILLGFALAAVLVILKFLRSTERKETCKVELAWRH